MTAYRVETERLVLCCWSPIDAPLMREALDASNEHLRPWIPFMRDEPRSLSETVEFVRKRRALFDRGELLWYAIFTAEGETLVGELMIAKLEPGGLELGYWIDVRQVGKGYAKEATWAGTRLAFEIEGARRVEIHCSPENEASAAIPARLGFVHEATLRERFLDSEGDYQDTMVWTLFANDYSDSPVAAPRLQAFDVLGELVLGTVDDGL